MVLLWSLLVGLFLVGADAYIDKRAMAVPSYEGGTPPVMSQNEPGVELWEDGTPIPPPK
jgi:hypothetical protein